MDPLSGIRYGAQIAQAAQAHGVDPKLLAAVAAQETGGPGERSGQNIVGDAGHGRGLFQIDDRYHAFAKTAGAMDPAKNADYAASFLSQLLARFGGNVRSALSAYNAGSPDAAGTQTTWPDGRTLGYADSVLRHESELQSAPEQTGSNPAVAAQAPPAPFAGIAALAVPQWSAPPWQFRSFESELQTNGAAADVDKGMAAVIDPSSPGDGDAPQSA